MLNIPAFAQEQNLLSGTEFIMLFELEIAPGTFLRFARWLSDSGGDVTFEGHTWEGFGFGDGLEINYNSHGEIPAFDVVFTNVGRSLQSVLEFYVVESRRGRVLWVHPDHLGDATAKVEESFVVVSAKADSKSATITATSTPFDPLGIQIPSKLTNLTDFPGLIGNPNRFQI